MSQFIWDMIHLTEGEKALKYWWLWLVLVAAAWVMPLVAFWRHRRGR